MDEKELRKIIRQGEGLAVEFKRAKTALPDNLFESVAAFLNRNGGHIVLGVTDDKKIDLFLCSRQFASSQDGQEGF